MTAAELEARWAERVRANREQVDRVREVPDGPDFYGPVTSLFVADPRRTDEPVLDRLRELVEPGETWLDIGAGAGRYALPLALITGEVIAIDPSVSMLAALHDQADELGIANVRSLEGRWPPNHELRGALGAFPAADVSLIAHVGYDIEAIGPFLDAMEQATRRMCVAVLMERQPASAADPFWPRVHREARVPLPALAEFVALVRARGRHASVAELPREPREFDSRDELAGFVRRQLWIADGGEKERRFHDALDDLVEGDGHFRLAGQAPSAVGVVTWAPR
ncbi:MAG TPA: methyltransferase domain-containing protein [Candidatus Limnocylindrales bacterium]